jgi:hypothetical protein
MKMRLASSALVTIFWVSLTAATAPTSDAIQKWHAREVRVQTIARRIFTSNLQACSVQQKDYGFTAVSINVAAPADVLGIRLAARAGFIPETAAVANLKLARANRGPIARLLDLHGPYMANRDRTEFLKTQVAEARRSQLRSCLEKQAFRSHQQRRQKPLTFPSFIARSP